VSSRIQAFDSVLNRLIKDASAGGDPGPLSADYLFGLANDPTTDNLFPMPSGNLRFPGYIGRGSGTLDAGIEYFQDDAIDFTSPPSFMLASMATNHTVEGTRTWFELEMNDPTWNGDYSQIQSNWIVESVIYSRDVTQGPNHTGSVLANRQYSSLGSSANTFPITSSNALSMFDQLELFNGTVGSPVVVEQRNGYGAEELLLYALENGANAQFLTHWQNHTINPATGDGPAWIIDGDGRFEHYNPRAALQAYQLTAFQNGGYGWRLFGAADSTPSLATILDVSPTAGFLNGAPIATLDVGAFGVESFESGVVDFTTTSTGNVIVPAKAGKRFFVVSAIEEVATFTGALTTGPTVQVKYGAAAVTAAAANTPSATNVALGVPQRGAGLGVSNHPNPANTAVTFDVTVGAVGTTLALTGKFVVVGYYF
jgi:hypothetical protein